MLSIIAFTIVLNMVLFPVLWILDVALSFATNGTLYDISGKYQHLKYDEINKAFNINTDAAGNWLGGDMLGGFISIIALCTLKYWILVPIVIIIGLFVCRHYTRK